MTKTTCTCRPGSHYDVTALDQDCPEHGNRPAEPDTDDTRREDEPGDWCIADFDGECSRCGRTFGKDVTVRADSDGDWECRVCVDEDNRLRSDQDAYERELSSGRAFGGAA